MNISLICACKNRYDSLIVSLNSWLRFKEIQEIIVVDWNSDQPISHITNIDERIKVITVQNQKYFNQPQPLNLAASIAKGDYILKCDTDYIINPYYDFFGKYIPDDKKFISGHHNYVSPEYVDPKTGFAMIDKTNMPIEELMLYVNSYSAFFKYLTGMLFVSKENFDAIGGYDETFYKYYAFEDDDICRRLRNYGLEQVKIDYDHHLIHIPHPDRKRIENFEGFDGSYEQEIIKNTDVEKVIWQNEYYTSQLHIKKNKQLVVDETTYLAKPKTKWNLVQIDDQNYFAEKVVGKVLQNFPKVYYVSLEESVDRQKHLEKQFETHGVTEFHPIISKRFAEADDKVTGKYLHQLNAGTAGCAVSHLKAIKDWYENTDEPYGFFCEDDLSLEPVDYWDFTWEEFIESLPEDAECVQLVIVRQQFDTFKIRERYWDDWSATAYILTRDYAKKIIDQYIKEDTYHLEIPDADVMPLIENVLFTSMGKVYAIPLFVENTEFDSTFTKEQDDDVNEGQKRNHFHASQLVLNWWKSRSTLLNLEEFEKDKKTTVSKTKTEIEGLLTTYSMDTEDPMNNFNLGNWYWKQGHTAPALTFFLRCAERATDDNLAYEALIWSSYCYDKQGTRDGSARCLLQQAVCVLPERPEAYFLLSRFSERRQWWQDTYIIATQGLTLANFDCPPLILDVEYPGKYGLLFEKAIAAYWWGKNDESISLFTEILETFDDVDENYVTIIHENLNKMGAPIPKK